MTAQSRDSTTRTAGAAWGALSGGFNSIMNASAQADYQNQINEYQRQMSRLGKPRLPPDHVAALVQLKGDVVADGSISFVYGSESIYSHLAPHFRTLPLPPERKQTSGLVWFLTEWEHPLARFLGQAITYAIGGVVLYIFYKMLY